MKKWILQERRHFIPNLLRSLWSKRMDHRHHSLLVPQEYHCYYYYSSFCACSPEVMARLITCFRLQAHIATCLPQKYDRAAVFAQASAGVTTFCKSLHNPSCTVRSVLHGQVVQRRPSTTYMQLWPLLVQQGALRIHSFSDPGYRV